MDIKIRKSAVAGSFYPGDKKTLAEMIKIFSSKSEVKSEKRPVALISPHAGYIFSGQIASDAYKQAENHKYETIIVLGSNHSVAGFRGVAVYPGAFETPLGTTSFCAETANEIVEADRRFQFDENPHVKEHSIEVQLPFIQTLFPEAKIVMAVVGYPDHDLCKAFGKTLSEVAAKRPVLIVASSDLSHFPKYKDAVKVDTETLESIATLNTVEFSETLKRNENLFIKNLATCACGEAPILSVMNASNKLKVSKAEIISYANSGDVEMGDKSRVVGYGAVVFS